MLLMACCTRLDRHDQRPEYRVVRWRRASCLSFVWGLFCRWDEVWCDVRCSCCFVFVAWSQRVSVSQKRQQCCHSLGDDDCRHWLLIQMTGGLRREGKGKRMGVGTECVSEKMTDWQNREKETDSGERNWSQSVVLHWEMDRSSHSHAVSLLTTEQRENLLLAQPPKNWRPGAAAATDRQQALPHIKLQSDWDWVTFAGSLSLFLLLLITSYSLRTGSASQYLDSRFSRLMNQRMQLHLISSWWYDCRLLIETRIWTTNHRNATHSGPQVRIITIFFFICFSFQQTYHYSPHDTLLTESSHVSWLPVTSFCCCSVLSIYDTCCYNHYAYFPAQVV